MRKWLFALFLLLPTFALGQSSPCVETHVGYYVQTPCYLWDTPPCYTVENPVESGGTGCALGVCHFEQVWQGPVSLSWILNIQIYRTAANYGLLKFYICSNPTESGALALDLTSQSGLWGLCAWSSSFIINLNSLEGFEFKPGESYYIRVLSGSNSHLIHAMRFCANEEVGTENSSWGAVKTIYR